MTFGSAAPALECEVLVVGAGPAGSACAQALARAGRDVLLLDRHAFPRDKVCGDALIPDAHRALARLGVLADVLARAQRAQHVACTGPRGGRVEVPGTLAVLPRRELDAILQRAALAAGARWLAPARFEALLRDARGRVCGARLLLPDGAVQAVRARWTVLATGANAAPLLAAGLCRRRTPSGMALRGYVRHATLAARSTALEIVWHRALRRGYGWIFPAPGGVFNIGVGLTHSHGKDGAMQDASLRQLFDGFVQSHAPARELVQGGELLGDLKGAPLRCSLEGARWSDDGLLVTGEAAGSTYSFSGEGIGKALETGLLAADALQQHAAGDAAVRTRYEAALAALKPRFDLYEKANRVNDHPWLADFVIWRTRRDPRVMRRVAGVLEESSNPGNLVTPRGLVKLIWPPP